MAALLPGLWLLLLAALLGAALARWYDPVPLRCWALWGAVLAVLFGSALLGGRVLLPLGYLARVPPYLRIWDEGQPPGNMIQADLVQQIVPWLVQVREALRAGEWPLWNPLVGAGEPLLGNPQSQALQPLTWLTLPLTTPGAVNATDALRVLIPLVFFFLFLRRQGLSEAPALWGSLAYSLAGFLQGWLGWPLAGSAAFLPLLLYAVVMVDERGERRDVALCTLAGAAVLLVGHPETELYVFAIAAAFALARLRARPAGRRLTLVRSWALAGVVALGLAAPALLPAFTYLPQTVRAAALVARREAIAGRDPFVGLKSPEARARTGKAMAARLVPLAAPNAYGNNRLQRYWGEQNVLNDSAVFTGSAALLACLVAFVPLRSGRRLPQERLVLGIALLSLIVVAQPPGLIELFNVLPLLRDSASFHSRLSLGVNFSLAYLAAATWERWRRGEVRRGAVLAAAALLAAFVTWAYLAHPDPQDPASLADLRMGSLAAHLLVLTGSALLLALVRPDPSRSWSRSASGLGLTLLLAGELLFVFAPGNPGVPARLFYPETEPIAFLKERLRPGERMTALGNDFRPNFPSVHGLADPRRSNPIRPAAYQEVIRRINRAASPATDGFQSPEDPLYDLLGVRFVLTAPRTFLPRPLRLSSRRGGAWVYRRQGALPLLFLPASTEVCATGSPWSACIAGVKDFADRAVLREGDRWAATAPVDLKVNEVRPAYVQAKATLTEARLLASSIYQDGGWKLLLDGNHQPTTTANGPFVAAWLPAKTSRVDMIYRPPGFLLGMGLAAMVLATAALCWVPRPSGSATRREGRIGTRG